MDYSIVIPVYNSGDWIEELIVQIENVMDQVTKDYEIICVNDGSPKLNTWPALKKACVSANHLKAINLHYNAGQFNAVLCGMSHASGRYVITLDDDFQHEPKEILKLIGKMKESDCDCVIAAYNQKKHGLIRKMGSAFVNLLSEKIYNKPKGITSTSFRLMKHELAQALTEYQGKSPQIGPLIFSITKNITTVEIEHKERAYGKSGYTMGRLIRETFNVVINGSTAPIDAVSVLGIGVSGGSFLLTIFYFIRYIMGGIQVQGFTTLILLISFFFGLVLLSIGIIGKYIVRLVDNMIGLPAYSVSEIVYSEKEEKHE